MDILNLRTNKYNNNTYKIILNVKQTKKILLHLGESSQDIYNELSKSSSPHSLSMD